MCRMHAPPYTFCEVTEKKNSSYMKHKSVGYCVWIMATAEALLMSL